MRAALVHRQIAADAVSGAVIVVQTAAHNGARANESICAPVVPETARAMAMWPLSTSV